MKRQQDKLLIIIAMSGEMPTYLGQYVTGSVSYTAALITRLKKERYISLRCKDGYRGYVLLEKGRNYLLSEYEKELSFFISGSGQTGHVKSEPEKRMRLYRMSEVWVFFWKAGIEILRNHKPDMDKGFVRDRGKAFYYGSLEFKGMSEAIRGSRSCGVLLSGDTALVVYNTMDRNMKWAKKMECSMRTWTERMLLKGGYNNKADALIVGQNIKVLLKLLESDGGIKKDLFRPDDIYDQYYYIPMCREGILQIVLLTEKRKREKLKQSLFSRFSIKREKEYATYNVCDENGNPIYLVYDLEMRQLCRIKQELLWRPSVSIVCMDYQAETIREYLGEKRKCFIINMYKTNRTICICRNFQLLLRSLHAPISKSGMQWFIKIIRITIFPVRDQDGSRYPKNLILILQFNSVYQYQIFFVFLIFFGIYYNFKRHAS